MEDAIDQDEAVDAQGAVGSVLEEWKNRVVTVEFYINVGKEKKKWAIYLEAGSERSETLNS